MDVTHAVTPGPIVEGDLTVCCCHLEILKPSEQRPTFSFRFGPYVARSGSGAWKARLCPGPHGREHVCVWPGRS